MSLSPIKLLTGAPMSSTLDWDDDSLLEGHLPCFLGFLGLLESDSYPAPTPSNIVKWRVVSKTGLVQSDQEGKPEEHLEEVNLSHTLYPAAELALDAEAPVATGGLGLHSELSHKQPCRANGVYDFYEHSFAMHNGLQSSQIADITELGDATMFTETSFAETTTTTDNSFVTDISITESFEMTIQLPQVKSLINLRQVPSAGYLNSINPQTVTVNLVAGVIAVASPRTVQLRQAKQEMDIVELTVGDETQAGFQVTFWLHPGFMKDELREALNKVRPQDVVLIRNVALRPFRGNVYGQSLRGRKSKPHAVLKSLTSIEILDPSLLEPSIHAAGIKAEPSDHEMSLLSKGRRVQQWIEAFVGPTKGKRDDESGTDRVKRLKDDPCEELPPDTQ